MNSTEQGIASHIGMKNLLALQQVCIGIAGAGGLGSNCGQLLVRAGFKRLVVVDHDQVEASNLNRQFFFPDQVGLPKVVALAANLLRINQNLDLRIEETVIDAGNVHQLFAGCDAVVECVDNALTKKMLAETLAPGLQLFVAASGIAGSGNADRIKSRILGSGFILVGDENTAVHPESPAQAPLVSVAASKQADAVLAYFFPWEHKEMNNEQSTGKC